MVVVCGTFLSQAFGMTICSRSSMRRRICYSNARPSFDLRPLRDSDSVMATREIAMQLSTMYLG